MMQIARRGLAFAAGALTFTSLLVLAAGCCWSQPAIGSAPEAHGPLLPRPRQIRYGSGRLPVCAVQIVLADDAEQGDREAASELSQALSASCPQQIPVGGRAASPSALPIRLTRTGAPDPLPVPGETPGPDSREAYTVIIGPKGGEIRARSTAGLFYAAQTVRQLAEGRGASAGLPEVQIHDWPEMPYRGTMIDTSHGPLPTEGEVKRQIDFLARWKGNQYYFYSEASIEMDGYPLINPEGHYTKEQVRRIIEYGRLRHIDVVPLVELYGHLHDLLRVEHYSHLGGFPHGPELDPSNPEAMKVVADWAGQLSELFPSPFVHIGFDETWQIEMLAKKLGGTTAAQLWVRQATQVAGLFQSRGKTVLAWTDILDHYPTVVDSLPKGLVSVVWECDKKTGPAACIAPIAARKLPHMIEVGAEQWHQIGLNFDATYDTLDQWVNAGRASHAGGLINAIWLDSSYSPLRLALPDMAYGAVATWQTGSPDHAEYMKQYTSLMYSAEAAPAAAAAFDKINRSEVTIEKVLGNDCFYEIWEDPFDPERLKRTAENRDTLHQARMLAEDAETEVYRALEAGGDAGTLNPVLMVARMLDYASYRYLDALEIAERWQKLSADFHPENWWREFESEVPYQSHSRIVDLMDAITELREFYRMVWFNEYQPYRFGTTIGRFDAEYNYWRGLQSRFREVGRHLDAKKGLPPLQSVLGAPR
jgi:hexosaminidase